MIKISVKIKQSKHFSVSKLAIPPHFPAIFSDKTGIKKYNATLSNSLKVNNHTI